MAAHEGQFRRGGDGVPYIVHPLHVCLMLARFGYGEDVLVAALLHDVVEDCDDWTRGRVEEEFGAHVASVVAEVTEKKANTWAERKQHGIEKVARLSEDAVVLKAMDVLHNMSSLIADLRAANSPEEVWGRFNGGREGTLEVQGKMIEALSQRLDAPMTEALTTARVQVLKLDARG